MLTDRSLERELVLGHFDFIRNRIPEPYSRQCERLRHRGSPVKRNVQLDRIAGTKVARAKISLEYKFTFEVRRGFRVMQYVKESAK